MTWGGWVVIAIMVLCVAWLIRVAWVEVRGMYRLRAGKSAAFQVPNGLVYGEFERVGQVEEMYGKPHVVIEGEAVTRVINTPYPVAVYMRKEPETSGGQE